MDSFGELVHEAFIRPLRSVLIVDDQYPTWEEIFNSKIDDHKNSAMEENSNKKAWHGSNISREISNLVRNFRRRNPGLIIDIHDGLGNDAGLCETPQGLANHLHQSDLLILDYNLEGAETGTGGALARQILSSVLRNQHFNLVVVHTSEDIDEVFYESVIALMDSYWLQTAQEITTNFDEAIDDAEAAGDLSRADIVKQFDKALYLALRSPEKCRTILGEFIRGEGKLSSLSEISDKIEINGSKLKEGSKKDFFYWALREYEISIKELFSKDGSLCGLHWSENEKARWLRASRGFVCFVKKGPEDLLADLEASLVDWRPSPSKLLSAKYRDEISRRGAEVEDEALHQNHAHAKFYDTILNPRTDGLEVTQIDLLRRQRLQQYVAYQSEMLSFLVEEDVIKFGARIVKLDQDGDLKLHEHYGVDLSNAEEMGKATRQYNRQICCLPSKTTMENKEQLDSGHIFKIGNDWWVCATPACDLQPGQSTIAFSNGNDRSLRPFTALKLHKVPNLRSESHTSYHINSGSYCYIEYDNEIIGLGIKPSGGERKGISEIKVTWRSMIAKNGGMIINDQFDLFNIHLDLEDEKIKSTSEVARVVAKLRYEYALNFIQRVGGSVSRIGLGYVT